MPELSTRDWAVDVPVGYRVGRWQVTAPLATGSWGSVYAATRIDAASVDLPERAALKFLPTGTLTKRSIALLQAMTERERRARDQLRHEHVISTYEVLVVDDITAPALDGSTVLVMELAESSVQHLIDAHPRQPVPDAARIIREIATALDFINRNKWIHADVKPSNILLTAEGSVRLTDFGLAAELDGTHGYLPPAGSADYAPPESRSEPLTDRGRAVRPALDVWAFGVVCYQLLTGRRPFAGDVPSSRAHQAMRYASGERDLVNFEALPAEWRGLVRDCLDPDPQRRPAIGEVVARLAALSFAPAGRARRRLLAWLAAALVVVVVITTAALWLARRPVSPAVAPLSPTASSTPAVNWREVFRDDFDGSSLDQVRWAKPYDDHIKWEASHSVVVGGFLELKSYRDPRRKAFLSGGVFASAGAERIFGRYDVRYRVDPNPCMSYSIMLFPSGSSPHDYIWLAEDGGGDRGRINGALMLGADEKPFARHELAGDFTTWHIIRLDWTKGRLNWYLDGQQFAEDSTPVVPNDTHSLVIQSEPLDGAACAPATLQVDSVVVYAPD